MYFCIQLVKNVPYLNLTEMMLSWKFTAQGLCRLIQWKHQLKAELGIIYLFNK